MQSTKKNVVIVFVPLIICFCHVLLAQQKQIPPLYGDPNAKYECAQPRNRLWELYNQPAPNLDEIKNIQKWLEKNCKGKISGNEGSAGRFFSNPEEGIPTRTKDDDLNVIGPGGTRKKNSMRDIRLVTSDTDNVWRVVQTKSVLKGNSYEYVPGSDREIYPDPVDAPEKEGKRKRAYDWYVFLKSNKPMGSDHSLPISLEDPYYAWRDGQDIDGEFLLVKPSTSSDKVWIIGPSGVIPVPYISADWFNHPENSKSHRMDLLHQKLWKIVAQDPEAKLISTPQQSDKSFFVLGSRNNPYFLGIRYKKYDEKEESLKYTYHLPIKLLSGNESSKRYIESLRKTFEEKNVLPAPLKEIARTFEEDGKQNSVIVIYPVNCSIKGGTPIDMFGGINNGEPNCLTQAIKAGEEIEFLISDGNSCQIWKGINAPENTWYNSVMDKTNPWLAWLAMIDNSIKIITQDEKKICFTSDKWPSTVWRWEWENNRKPPKQVKVVENIFKLTGKPSGRFIPYLRENVDNNDNFKKFLLTANIDNVQLLDFFESTGVLLYERVSGPSKPEGCISRGYILSDYSDGEYTMDFYNVGIQRTDRLQGILSLYNAVGRKELESRIASPANLEIWWGDKRLGIYENESKQVSVFFENQAPDRPFGPASLDDIIKMVKLEIQYKRPHKNLLKQDLFTGWLSDWRASKVWRADPLGYFYVIDK